MVVNVRSLGLTGLSGYEVNVECFLSGGLPAFDVVGLPDAAVREARERVRAAVKNCGAKFPVSRITVNLAPASQRKEGTVYDLPIALGILTASEDIRSLPADAAFMGELSLSGALRPVAGVLPMALYARRAGIRQLFVPAENAAREIQKQRFAGTAVTCNAYMTPAMIGQHCALDAAGEKLMKNAFDRLGLTGRSHDRILRMARTIADLEGCEHIEAGHLAEAIQYRSNNVLK